jgi:hypothetical protein
MTQHPDLGPVAGPVAGAGAGAGADARPGRFAARGRREAVELTLAVVVVLATSVHLLRFVRIAWYVSLWNDEVWSVVRYSGHGPIHVVTHYGSANNHVFFNLVNALTPGAGSADPARARWWSIVAVLAMQVIVLVVFWRRRWYLAGAVLFGLFATSPEWLDLTLQARGYGFLGLAALLSCTTLWRYLEAWHGSPAGRPGDGWVDGAVLPLVRRAAVAAVVGGGPSASRPGGRRGHRGGRGGRVPADPERAALGDVHLRGAVGPLVHQPG